MVQESFSVSSFIEKSENKDKDFRHMALYDLNTELQKENFKLDDASQRQIAEIVLKLLDDTSSDVQSMAVKCLAPLVQKLSKQQIENAVSKLSNSILDGADEKRDIAKLALKTVITKVPADISQGKDLPVKKCLDPLLKAIRGSSAEIKQDAMEVLADLVARFGNILQANHKDLQDAFATELLNKKQSVRKRAIDCLATLSVFTNEKLFSELVEKILAGAQNAKAGGEDLRTFIRCSSAMSKTAGYRLGKYLDRFVKILLDASEEISEKEGEDEVREYIMQAFESFIIRCPDEIKKHIDFILILCKEYLEYDPNYSYDSSDEEEESADKMEDEEDETGDEGADYSDDDDLSWKVRTAAIKCLGALIRTRSELLNTFYKELCCKDDYTLLSRFKERTESVKLEVFNVFNELLSQTVSQTTLSSGEVVYTPLKEVKYLKDTKKVIMNRLKKQLAQRNEKVRLGAFSVLKKLIITLQGGLDEYFTGLVPVIKTALSDKDDQHSALKLEVLSFVRLSLRYHKPETFVKQFDALSKVIYERVNERYYKIIAEALRVCGEWVSVVASQKSSPNFNKYVKDIYATVLDRLSVQDIDQDVKESSIHTMGLVISKLGSSSEVKLKECLPILLDRLKNEITRLTTCKTFGIIAQENVDISPVLDGATEELALYLRKYNRPLRQAALTTLKEFAKSYKNKISAKLYRLVLTETEKLVSDSDLFLAHLALELTAQVLVSYPEAVQDVNSIVLPKILDLLNSTTLQGSALESLLKVLKAVAPTYGFSKLLNTVLDRALKLKTIQKQVFTNVGKSIAAICQISSENEKKATIDQMVNNLKSNADEAKMLALFTLGEIGRHTDLSGNKAVLNDIDAFFDNGSEEIKNAASYSLGNISVGNLGFFVPYILNQIQQKQNRKYLMLSSLKEVISQAPADKLQSMVSSMVQLLFENCDNSEEGIRNVVSECLGKLALVEYTSVMTKLKASLADASDVKKSAIISAVKYTVTDQPRPIDEKLKVDVLDFLKNLKKPGDVAVRRAAVLLLTSIAHNKPILIRDNLNKFLPNLYEECVFDETLIRIIKLGPFNHRVDDGLELRKSAFECLDTILDSLRERLDPTKFIQQLPLGLSDENEDIKLLTDLILIKVADVFPEELLQNVTIFIKPLTDSLRKKLKDNALPQEKERHEELLNSTLRVVNKLNELKGVEDNVEYNETVRKTINDDLSLKQMLKSIQEGSDSSSTGAGDVTMADKPRA